MSRLNVKHESTLKTHEGAPAKVIAPYQALRRSVMAGMLWEDSFYEDGESVVDRIQTLIPHCTNEEVAALAIEARTDFRLRHMPLLLMRELARVAKHKNALVADTLAQVIQRADELAEFLALYWKDGKQPLSAQVKKGLAKAFVKFDAYQLAKYNRDNAIKLRDVMFLVHPKPENKVQEAVWKRLVEGKLAAPDTWEVALSAGADKKDTFMRLISNKKLGYLALLRNLRNMKEAGVPKQFVREALIDGAAKSKALPFRFVAADHEVPSWADIIEEAMLLATADMQRLEGRTAIAVDCSGSMKGSLSKRSKMNRFDAAAALAILVREIADEVDVYAYGTETKLIANRRGFALRDALRNSGVGWATYLGNCVNTINQNGPYDRVIVITDEQSHDKVPDPYGTGYVINVATYQNGVGYCKWIHIDGFSEATVRFIQELEK